jgi:hypothetical protein
VLPIFTQQKDRSEKVALLFSLKFAQLQRKNVCHNTFSNLLLFDIFYLFILKVALFQALAARGHPTPVFQTLGML